MSVKYSYYVWKDKDIKKHSDLSMMLALADHANDDGIAWPGQSRLGEKTRMSARTVQRTLQRLVKIGKISLKRVGNGRQSTVYRLNYENDETYDTKTQQDIPLEKEPVEGCQIDAPGVSKLCHPRGVKLTPQGCQNGTPILTYNEPTNNRHRKYNGSAKKISDEARQLVKRFKDEFPRTYCVSAPKQIQQELVAGEEMLASGETIDGLVSLCAANATSSFPAFRGQSATLSLLQRNLAAIKARNEASGARRSDGNQIEEHLTIPIIKL